MEGEEEMIKTSAGALSLAPVGHEVELSSWQYEAQENALDWEVDQGSH